MKIDPGYYKIEKKGSFDSSYHYMRVFIKNKVKYFQIGNSIPQEADKVEEDIIHYYKLVKRIRQPIQVRKLEIKLSWSDEDGDLFEMNAKSRPVLDNIFELFPRVKKAFDGFDNH